MTVEDLIGKGIFQVVAEGDDLSREITGIFCCDLLSVAMGRAPSNSAWVTVMGNVNTIAVATLADVSCVILAENAQPDEMCLARSRQQGVTLLATEEPVFEAALKVHQELHG